MVVLQMLFWLTPSLTHAFHVTSSERAHIVPASVVISDSIWSLHGKSSRRRDDDDGRDVAALNKARTDIRNFLTQRSIQSFIFLLHQCRDGATVRWLEVSNQKHYQSLYNTGTY